MLAEQSRVRTKSRQREPAFARFESKADEEKLAIKRKHEEELAAELRAQSGGEES